MSRILTSRFLWICLWLVHTQACPAQDFSSELPRISPTSPQEALRMLEVADGFRVELVASEPLLGSPVAIEWDAKGRMYVCEMRGYSEEQDDELSSIALLTDEDHDGTYDKRTLFASGLRWPTAIFPYRGGLFVGDAPHLYYMADEDQDGVADGRQIVLTGFGTSNVQGLMNSMRWSLDNKIHIACSSTGGQIRRPGEENSLNVRGRDLAFDPETFELELISGAAQHGMCFDDWGRKFVSANSDHIIQVLMEDSDIARNPQVKAPSPKVSIALDGPQAEVFRSSEVEPWRVVRTRLRVAGEVPGPIEGGGRSAGYFTGATGVTIFRGDAWPEDQQGLAIVGDVGSNLVHRKRLALRGLEFRAARIDPGTEFIRSRDNWFRPVQFANAPDGTLHIIDMCREVIEHPKSLPPVIKRHLDLTSGRERGRILRVVSMKADRPRVNTLERSLEDLETSALVELLGHRNAWHRETAARLLYERQDRSAIPLLKQRTLQASEPLGQLHALYVLRGLGGLEAKWCRRLLEEQAETAHSQVIRHAIRLLHLESQITELPLERMLAFAEHDSIEVRFQLAIAAGGYPAPQREEILAHIIRQDFDDRWLRTAVQCSLNSDASQLLAVLIQDVSFRGLAQQTLLENLATQVSRQDRGPQLERALLAFEAAMERGLPIPLTVLGELLKQREGSPAFQTKAISQAIERLDRNLVQELTTATSTALDADKPTDLRVAATRDLRHGKISEVLPTLKVLLKSSQPVELQRAALDVLNGSDVDQEVVSMIVEAWPTMTPGVTKQAAEVMFARKARVQFVMQAIEQGRLDPKAVGYHHFQSAAKNWPELRTQIKIEDVPSDRAAVLAKYQEALRLKGDVAQGQAAFLKHCSVCHQLESEGFPLGPNLATMKARGEEAILVNLLDPNREVNPQYLNYAALTTDDRVIQGMITSESSTTVTFTRQKDQSSTLLRSDIAKLTSRGASVMPEGFEKQLTQQNVADLIAYLMSLN